MTGEQFTKYIRNQTSTDSSSLPDEEIVSYANIAKQMLALEIAKVNEDIFGLLYCRNLRLNKREYCLPKCTHRIKYVETDINGDGEYERTPETDLNLLDIGTNEESIRRNFTTPHHLLYRDSLWIFSNQQIIDVINGIKLWAIVFPMDLTISDLSRQTDLSLPIKSDATAMPIEIHEVWAEKVIIFYKNSKDKPLPLTSFQKSIDVQAQKAINSISQKNLDREIFGEIPHDDGYDY